MQFEHIEYLSNPLRLASRTLAGSELPVLEDLLRECEAPARRLCPSKLRFEYTVLYRAAKRNSTLRARLEAVQAGLLRAGFNHSYCHKGYNGECMYHYVPY